MNACITTRLLTSSQAAARLGISLEQLGALRRIRNGPEWGQFEGAIRYDATELDAWAKQQLDQPAPTRHSESPTPSDG